MSPPRFALLDLDAYLAQRVQVANARGGHGHDLGVRTFSCPFCRDQTQRGWLNVERGTAGCWNAGCPAEPRLEGGAVEWVRLTEGLASRGQAWSFLHRNFPRLGGSLPGPVAPPEHKPFCRLPPGYRLADLPVAGRLAQEVARFLTAQWSVPYREAADRWDLRVCVRGPHAYRIVIPITLRGVLCSFQSRTFRHGEPKYRSALEGEAPDPRAETGTPMGSLLFNLDAVREGDEVVLVEGAGDVMGWHARPNIPGPAVGLLGLALTPERAALLAGARPGQVAVALDTGDPEQQRAQDMVMELRSWGQDAILGTWTGGKDAGTGAAFGTAGRPGLRDRLEARLWPPRRG